MRIRRSTTGNPTRVSMCWWLPTTGQGDLPDSIVPLYEGIKDMYQPHLRYGIIALGDSTYANFAAAA